MSHLQLTKVGAGNVDIFTLFSFLKSLKKKLSLKVQKQSFDLEKPKKNIFVEAWQGGGTYRSLGYLMNLI